MTLVDPRTCIHADHIPVETRNHSTGRIETVARLCIDCHEQHPTWWGCGDCETVEVRELCDAQPRPILTLACRQHQEQA